MPTYEFNCAKCQHITEKICSFKDRFEAPECEKCGGETHQIISSTSFVLSGSGWARDGYGGSPKKETK